MAKPLKELEQMQNRPEQNKPSQVSEKETKHSKIALALSIIPGLGQVYNKQYLKGAGLFLLASAFMIATIDMLMTGTWGLMTLGEVAGRDHSIRLLIEGIIALIVLSMGLIIYYINLNDAYKVGKLRDQGGTPNSVREQFKNLVDNGFPYLMISPGYVLLLFVVILPIIFIILLAFTNYDLYHSPPAKLVDWIGIQNFVELFTLEQWRNTFLSVASWTVVWTALATTSSISLGIFMAILVNQKDVKFKKLWRTILILPWAVPAFVTILIFSGMFNETIGVMNETILPMLGIEAKSWMNDPFYTRMALIMIQTWLGFPFIFLMVTGVLQAIPADLYEAASIDGATRFQQFRLITLPLVLYATAPIMITQYTFNFNNFSLIYLFNGGGPAVPGQTAGGTDLLISWIYNLTMNSAQYGKAAAITLIISAIVIGISIWQFKRTKSFSEEGMI